MNEQERIEFERLKARQKRLEAEIVVLAEQIERLEGKLKEPQTATLPPSESAQIPEQTSIAQPKSPESISPPATPAAKPRTVPPREEPPEVPQATPVPPSELEKIASPAVPPIIEHFWLNPESGPTAPQRVAEVQPLAQSTPSDKPAQDRVSKDLLSPALSSLGGEGATAPAATRGSFEMRLGTFWLVRVGIVVLLTSLVFFGNLAYHTYISKLGPSGKICLLYFASGLLLGFGAWWQRQAVKEALKNYAQVLFAGGLAAVYFTTYAAHHIERLRVIASPALDGFLLLVWAGFIVWIADRKRSQVLALFAVLLAYYSSVITTVGLFTLYSNLLLTIAAVFFLVRNRWATLSFVSLGATYTAYGYWRFCNGQEWHWALPGTNLWTGAQFLIAYWVVFSAAVFLSRDPAFKGHNRASLLTANNGAFFILFLLTMYKVHHRRFWEFGIIYGTVLIGLAGLAKWVLADERITRNSYLTQGLMLATVGIISHPDLAGLNLALILATESVVLLATGQMRKNLVLLTGAYITAALAVGWSVDGMRQHDPHGIWLGAGLGGLMIVNSLLAHRHLRPPAAAEAGTAPQTSARMLLRPQPSYFTVLALVIWLVATWNNAARENFAFLLTLQAIGLIASIYVLRVPEIAVFGLGYLCLGQAVWAYDSFMGILQLAWWNLAAMVLLSCAVAHWWQRQAVLKLRPSPDFEPLTPENVAALGKALVLLAATFLAVRFAGGWQLETVIPINPLGIWMPIGIGAMMMMDAFLLHRQEPTPTPGLLRLQPSFSTALALVVWLGVTWHHTAIQNFPLALAIEAVALTLSIHALKMPEIPLLGQAYLLIAKIAWVSHFGFDHAPLPVWWNPILLIGISLGTSHWWQKQQAISLQRNLNLVWQGAYALAIVAVVYFWLSAQVRTPTWLLVTAALGIGFTAYGAFTRTWLLAAAGQIFVVVSVFQFALQIGSGKPAWYFPIATLAALSFLSWSAVNWLSSRSQIHQGIRGPVLGLAMIYRWLALLLSLFWVARYVSEREFVWVYLALGFVLFLVAAWRKLPEAFLWSATYSIAGLGCFWFPPHDTSIVYFPNLLALLLLLVQQRLAKRQTEGASIPIPAQAAAIVAGGLSLWFLLTRWVIEIAERHQERYGLLTASWSVFALLLFLCGMPLRERLYRWMGLVVLACSLVRAALFDVWKLEAVYRVLSFAALGVVLLVLGFLYTKYQEKIKEWL